MRQPVTIIQKKRKKTGENGTLPLAIQYVHSASERFHRSIGIHIPPRFWKKTRKKQEIHPTLPSEYGDVHQLNKLLENKLIKVKDMVEHAKRKKIHPIHFLEINFHLIDKWEVSQMVDERNKLDVFRQLDEYIEKKTEVLKCSKSVLEVIGQMKHHLVCFEKFRRENTSQFYAVTFDTITLSYYNELVHFLTYNYRLRRKKKEVYGLRVNSIGKSIKWFKDFLSDRMAEKIIPAIDLTGFHGMDEEVDAVYLNWCEIQSIYDLDLTDSPIEEIVRDAAVFGCLTGFRFSDLQVKPEDVRDDLIYIKQKKTGGLVIVPLRPAAKAILEKYNYRMPEIPNPVLNSFIKEICRKAGINQPIKHSYRRGGKLIEETRPKWAWVQSHTCRRSFCTNEFLDETPILMIMSISGHKTEKAFRRYIRADKLEVAKKIQEMWQNRPGIRV